jgi:hypothetical protein
MNKPANQKLRIDNVNEVLCRGWGVQKSPIDIKRHKKTSFVMPVNMANEFQSQNTWCTHLPHHLPTLYDTNQ